mmetsp:Transcript_102674/g.306653  ORF Transcript_102674/g.306653 Transcript_102674/m.306653 type:complete len:223 (-) Transcript_102674:156-824(-)
MGGEGRSPRGEPGRCRGAVLLAGASPGDAVGEQSFPIPRSLTRCSSTPNEPCQCPGRDGGVRVVRGWPSATEPGAGSGAAGRRRPQWRVQSQQPRVHPVHPNTPAGEEPGRRVAVPHPGGTVVRGLGRHESPRSRTLRTCAGSFLAGECFAAHAKCGSDAPGHQPSRPAGRGAGTCRPGPAKGGGPSWSSSCWARAVQLGPPPGTMVVFLLILVEHIQSCVM